MSDLPNCPRCFSPEWIAACARVRERGVYASSGPSDNARALMDLSVAEDHTVANPRCELCGGTGVVEACDE